MNSASRYGFCLLLSVFSMAVGWSQPYQSSDRTLLLDHLDEDFTPDGKLCTKPVAINPAGELSGGRPGQGGKFVEGRFGKALQFHGLMQMQYPAVGNINLSAGVVEFWAAFDFDAAEKIKDPGLLSNQLFFTAWGPGGSMVSIYSTLVNTCVGMWDKQRQLVCYASISGYWKKGEWHHIELKWGRQLELWCDGKNAGSQDWQGLFGPIDAKPEDVRITFGSHIGWSGVHSEFLLDEFRILGPGGEQTADYPILTIPRIKAPAIDGVLGKDEWKAAACVTGFIGLNDFALVEDQTTVHAGWDNEALYLLYECLDPQKRELVARIKERDGGVYMEDSVDVILQPGPGPYPYYQLISNAIGTVYDSRIDPKDPAKHNTKFNPNWAVKTTRESGRWVMECKIPFKELDGRPTPKNGERWRANFCRDSDTVSRYSTWSFVAGNYHRAENFGEIVFEDSDRSIRLASLGDWAIGKVAAQVAMTGLSYSPLVTVKGKITGADAKPIIETNNRLADYTSVTIKPPTLVTGAYTLTVRATTDQGDLFYQRTPFRVIKPYDVSAEGYPYEGKLWVTTNVAGLTDAPKGIVAKSQLMQGDKAFGSCDTAEFKRGVGEAAIDVTQLPPGKYVVKSQAVAPDGKVLAAAETDFEQFAKPAWWKSKAGLDRSIPSPWEPVRSAGSGIRVWGREYRCGDESLSTQIVNQGAEILAAPIALKLTVEGKTADLARLRAVDTAGMGDSVYRVSDATLGKLQTKLTTNTEFDGLQRCDLTLTPDGAVDITGLLLEILIKKKYAAFLLPSNGISSNPQVIGDKPWRNAFLPQVWVGNDDIGLAWFAESDQWWRPRDDQMLEVSPEGDRVVIRCKMIRQPLRIEKPVTITFGLMATPVKDAHAGDPFWFRWGRVDEGMPGEYLRYPGAGNFDPAKGTLDFWLAPTDDMQGGYRDVATLTTPRGSVWLYYSPAGDQRLGLTVTNGDRKEAITAKGLQLKLNEFTHVALTWGDSVSLYVGGKRCATARIGLPLADGAPGKSELRFGRLRAWTGYPSRMAVDEVRLSSVVRYENDAFDVPSAPFSPDAQTLLLDHLDDPFRPDGEDAETRAAVVSGKSGELGGTPSLGARFVAGRFGQGMEITQQHKPQLAELVRQYGFNASLVWWMIEENATTTGWPPPLMVEPLVKDQREKVKELNDLGLRASPYMGYSAVGAPSALATQFGNEWSRRPLSTIPAEPPKGHYMWDSCGNSGFADYMAAGTQWVLDDLGFQGCYTDGLAQVYSCQNTHHGCGYYDEQGNLRATWPVFATREMLKRMYKQIHARHTDGYLTNHVSYNTIIPTMSFTDVYYTGEHEQYEDLLKFRVRWQGKQWGIWPILLGGDCHCYESLHVTYALLHGVSVWPQGFIGRNDVLRKTANLWQAYDRFGYRQAKWIPYYRSEEVRAKSDNDNVKVSLYLRKGKSTIPTALGKAMLIVGNLAHEVVNCKVNLNLKSMGLKGKSATNALDGRSLPLQGSTLSVRVRPASFVLVEVE